MENNKSKIICFDIESSNLKGNIGRMLAFGWKVVGEKHTTVVSIAEFPNYKHDKTDDSELAKLAAGVLSSADIVVAHYGKFFDIPFINTRLMAAGLAPMPRLNLVDTWEIARKRLALNSNRLATLTQFFHLPSKTPVSWDDWAKALTGDRKALSYVVEHCRIDVRVLEKAYLKLRQLWPEHPALRLPIPGKTSCDMCGSTKLVSNGLRIAVKKAYRRLQCLQCGRWMRGKVS